MAEPVLARNVARKNGFLVISLVTLVLLAMVWFATWVLFPLLKIDPQALDLESEIQSCVGKSARECKAVGQLSMVGEKWPKDGSYRGYFRGCDYFIRVKDGRISSFHMTRS